MSRHEMNLEKTQLDIGIVALTDCAPLVMAQHLGYFEQFGLDVNLHIQHSWATVRDKLHADLLDATQMLAPMPLASTLGLNGTQCNVITAFNLSMNGNAITLSQSLFDKIVAEQQQVPSFPLDARYLKPFIDQDDKLEFAAVYPYSCQYYQLRDWLNSGGVNPDDDIELHIIPPTNMTEALEDSEIDGFCVGTPWNAKAVRAGIGATVVTSCDLWQDAPEKVLAVTEQWQQQNPNTFLAMLAAVQKACDWLQSTANRFEAAIVLEEVLNESVHVIAPSLIGSCLTSHTTEARTINAYNRFVIDDANAPTLAQGQFLLKKMCEAGQVSEEELTTHSQELLEKVYRPDLYQAMTEQLAS